MKFEKFIKTEKLPDSMCLDSGTMICHYEDGIDTIDVEVRGYVNVDYKGETYRHHSDMPKELQEMFADGSAYFDDNIFINESNWYEVSFNFDEEYDVAEIDGMDVADLEEYCKSCMALFRANQCERTITEC